MSENSAAVGAIIFCVVIIAISLVCCVINAAKQEKKEAGAPQTGNERDGNMVVLDGVQAAEAAVEIQIGCCCGGGGGDGGGCGGCGGD